MGVLKKMRAVFHDDWCRECQNVMEETGRKLYMLPMTVGHYQSHREADYYKKNLRPVSRKAEIPAGVYACGIRCYRCPECGHRMTKLSIFLPVREEEKTEDMICFDQGEMDNFIW